MTGSCPLTVLAITSFLLDLQAVHDGCQLAEDLVSSLVVFELSGDQVGDVAQRLGCVQDLMFKGLVSNWARKRM